MNKGAWISLWIGFGAACATPKPVSVIEVIDQAVGQQLGMPFDAVYPQEDGKTIGVGWVAKDGRYLDPLWAYCPGHEDVDDSAFVRKGTIANLKVARMENLRWGVDLGARGSDFASYLPALEMNLKRGEELSVSIEFTEGELVQVRDAHFMALWEQVAHCPGLRARFPVEYVSDMLLAKIKFTFEATGNTQGRVKLGWSKKLLDDLRLASRHRTTANKVLGDAVSSKPEVDEGEMDDSLVGLNVNGVWQITEGGVVESVGRLVFAVHRAPQPRGGR